MTTCQQSPNLVGSKFNCLNLYFAIEERQTPFNLDTERKLFDLAI